MQATIRTVMAGVRANPADPGGWVVLGDLLAREGDVEKAWDCYTRALVRAPGHVEARASLERLNAALASGENGYSLLWITEKVYALLGQLPRFNHLTPRGEWPQNGVYVFFEHGEVVPANGSTVARIVRVGTHREDGRFRERIREHYGNFHAPGGNHHHSVFRRHLGSALLKKVNPRDRTLKDWLAQNGPSLPEVEKLVSRVLVETFTFACFRVDDQEERRALRRGLTALLAQHPLGRPSPTWLGRHAASDAIARTGLWNTRDVDGAPLTLLQLHRLEQWVKVTRAMRAD